MGHVWSMDGGEGPEGGVGGSARRQGFWLHLDFPRMGMTFSVPCTSPCVTYLLSSFHLCIFSPSQQSALLTVGSQYVFTDLVKGWVKKARLYNSSQRNPKMLTNHAAKLLRDAFFADSVDVGRAAASGRVGLMLQTHLPVETGRVAELSA